MFMIKISRREAVKIINVFLYDLVGFTKVVRLKMQLISLLLFRDG
jgi:hypothetical protein